MSIITSQVQVQEELITVNKYKINGVYTPERAEKHRIIITEKIKNKVPSDEKVAVLLGGGSGAGKSTIVRQYFLPGVEDFDSVSDYTYIDADQIKLKLDEYQQYIENEDTVYHAAFYVHVESGDIVSLLLQECIDRDLSFIYDGTMSWKPLYNELLPKLKKKSYLTFGVYVDVELEVAQRRAILRGKKEKRYVDPEVVKKANRNSAIVFKQLKCQFDQVLMFNNTEEREQGSNAELLPFYQREVPCSELFLNGDILNPQQLELFIKKSDLPYLE